MALAPFFDWIYSALGGHLSVSRDDLAKSLEGVEIGIKCSPALSQNDLCIAQLSINLLARVSTQTCNHRAEKTPLPSLGILRWGSIRK